MVLTWHGTIVFLSNLEMQQCRWLEVSPPGDETVEGMEGNRRQGSYLVRTGQSGGSVRRQRMWGGVAPTKPGFQSVQGKGSGVSPQWEGELVVGAAELSGGQVIPPTTSAFG